MSDARADGNRPFSDAAVTGTNPGAAAPAYVPSASPPSQMTV